MAFRLVRVKPPRPCAGSLSGLAVAPAATNDSCSAVVQISQNTDMSSLHRASARPRSRLRKM
eukprot:5620654-Alexandrium_andersonii.AAC.1